MKKLIALVLLITAIVWWFKNPSIEATVAKVSFEYIVKYTGDADTSAPLPMLIVLHGNGDTPAHFFDTALDLISTPARIILIKAPINMGFGSAWPMHNPELQHDADAIVEVIPLRSEEHTSELQSHSFISYAVFCLKKKKITLP